MKVTDIITITELSRLTGKTRPTLYKYLNDYEANNLDNLPYSFKKLFDFILDESTTKDMIKDYCIRKFISRGSNDKERELFEILRNNKDKINIERIIEIVKEELK